MPFKRAHNGRTLNCVNSIYLTHLPLEAAWNGEDYEQEIIVRMMAA